MCNCFGPQIQVSTDGTKEWAYCPTCQKTWDMMTMREIKNHDPAN